MFLHFIPSFTAIITFIFLKTTFLNAANIGDDMQFDIDVVRHNPCHYVEGHSRWNRSFELESGDGKDGPLLKQQPGKPGCYIIGGRANVFQEFRTDFSVYLELRTSASKKKPAVPCINQESNGCGGLGSCLYCGKCSKSDSAVDVKAKLLKNGKELECNNHLSPGTHDNVEFEFCLPKMEQFLQTHGLNPELLRSLIQTEDIKRKLSIFVTAYIFNKNVSEVMQSESRIIADYKKKNKNESLPAQLLRTLPFNMLIRKHQPYVACHVIRCNIVSQKNT